MERSENIGELVTALAKAQGEFSAAVKDSDNPYYNSKYADLSAVINAVRPALSKHGIALIQTSEADLERQTASVTTSLHLGEEWISNTAEAPATGKGKKAPDDPSAPTRFDVQTIGAAWTYLRRYTLQGLVGVPAEDDDGNSVVGNNAPIKAKQPAENWKAQTANKAKGPSQTPTKLEGNILTATVKEIKSGKTKQGKEYRAVVLEDSISVPGAERPFDTVWVWHQSMWEDLAGMPGRECEFMVAASDKGFTLNSIIAIGGIEWTEPETKTEEVQP
jgi:hypothetical protein